LLRLEETAEKQAALTPKKDGAGDDKSAVKKALGLDLANLSDDLRKKHSIKDKVKGVVITAVDPDSPAAEKHLAPGMVIAEVQQQAVSTAADLQQRIDKLKKSGKKTVMLLVVTPDGDQNFVVVGLQ
jgi:serine protease Do